MKAIFKGIAGGVCAASGFEAAGVVAGIKSAGGPSGGKDIALLRSVVPAACAGVFTTNAVKAAPVVLNLERIRSGRASAVVINAGNANCQTGKRGYKDAVATTELVAQLLGIAPAEVLVCSTGIIGQFLPMAKITRGVRQAARTLSPQGNDDAAQAIMTTDTHHKQAAVEFEIAGKKVHIGGMAKGVGMLSPKLATMLAFITTDAALPAKVLQSCLKKAVRRSFNAVTVDGDMSTNDTVLLLANGAAGVTPKGRGLQLFQQGLNLVAERLATMLVKDGEGATKFIIVTVAGAPSDRQAEKVARAVANSPLVKSAVHGADPNWGRVLVAAGGVGVKFDGAKADVAIGGIPMLRRGEPTRFSPAKAHQALSAKEVEIALNLRAGPGQATIYTCDLSEEYVTFNADYHT